MFGMAVSAFSLATYVVVMVYRLILHEWRGPMEAIQILWDRDILAFFLIGMLLFGLGLIGENVGQLDVRHGVIGFEIDGRAIGLLGGRQVLLSDSDAA